MSPDQPKYYKDKLKLFEPNIIEVNIINKIDHILEILEIPKIKHNDTLPHSRGKPRGGEWGPGGRDCCSYWFSLFRTKLMGSYQVI